jgi:hypothetical protein
MKLPLKSPASLSCSPYPPLFQFAAGYFSFITIAGFYDHSTATVLREHVEELRHRKTPMRNMLIRQARLPARRAQRNPCFVAANFVGCGSIACSIPSSAASHYGLGTPGFTTNFLL